MAAKLVFNLPVVKQETDAHSRLADGPVENVPGGGIIRCESYCPTLRENIKAFRQGLALRLSTKKTLIVGPYAGEFGPEIMDFQSYVRWFRRKYREIHVITYPGRDPLYRGCIVHAHDFDLRTAGYCYGRISHTEITRYARDFARAHDLTDYDMFSTLHMDTRWHRRLLFRQEHEVISPLVPPESNRRILFHFRNIDKSGPDRSRNFRPDLVAETCELCLGAGIEITCIGHPKYSLCPPGCEDRRTENLEQTIAEMASGRLVAGELSGPLHLALFCARPVLIWAPGADRIAYAFKRNPFRQRIFVVRYDTTNPSPEEILEALRDAEVKLAA